MKFHIPIKAESRYPVDRKQIRKIIGETLKKNGLEKDVQVSVSFVGDRKMAELNQRYLGRSGTTDVLSFSLLDNDGQSKEALFVVPPDECLHLGEIIISFPQARKQAGQYGKTVDEEINNLVEHGLLHLLGKHHE